MMYLVAIFWPAPFVGAMIGFYFAWKESLRPKFPAAALVILVLCTLYSLLALFCVIATTSPHPSQMNFGLASVSLLFCNIVLEATGAAVGWALAVVSATGMFINDVRKWPNETEID